ncbi:hypothetical protein DFH09DRAFT_1194616 [Mycena vulgaris]|nr:hypothetical protein DFH09DRAFT_1194616 [Mycena vulgaris]
MSRRPYVANPPSRIRVASASLDSPSGASSPRRPAPPAATSPIPQHRPHSRAASTSSNEKARLSRRTPPRRWIPSREDADARDTPAGGIALSQSRASDTDTTPIQWLWLCLPRSPSLVLPYIYTVSFVPSPIARFYTGDTASSPRLGQSHPTRRGAGCNSIADLRLGRAGGDTVCESFVMKALALAADIAYAVPLVQDSVRMSRLVVITDRSS